MNFEFKSNLFLLDDEKLLDYYNYMTIELALTEPILEKGRSKTEEKFMAHIKAAENEILKRMKGAD